jgi:exonuclease VII small subunit
VNLCVSNIYCNCRLTASSCLYDVCAQCYTELFARRCALCAQCHTELFARRCALCAQCHTELFARRRALCAQCHTELFARRRALCAQCHTELFARRRALQPLRLTNEHRKMQSDISNPPSLPPPKSHALCKLRHKQNVTYAVETFVCLHKISIILEQKPDVSLRPRGEYFYPLASDVNIYNFRLFTWGTEIDRHTLKMGAVCPSEALAGSVSTA